MASYNTIGRTKILEYLIATKDRSICVQDILSYLKGNGIHINIATIYRCLEKLEAEGYIVKHNNEGESFARFRYIEPEHHCDEHLHLQCLKCGTIIHLDCDFMNEISKHILEDHCFKISCKNSVIYGICDNCKEIRD